MGCATAQPLPPGASRIAPEPAAESPASEAMRAAASETTMVVSEAAGTKDWRARLAADGSAHRLGDGRPGSWRIDASGRLCTQFVDTPAKCWRVARDGASEPSLLGPRGERARLEPARQQPL
jgi:hypothetical protein